MNVSVWDTYVQRNDNKVMHFDIIVPSTITDPKTVFEFGKDYLKTKSVSSDNLTTNECRFCHIEQASEKMLTAIQEKGYDIIEMENCY